MKYEYYGDDDIIDEDKIGKSGQDKAVLAFIFATLSILLVIFKQSGILAILFGILAIIYSGSALRYNPDSQLAKLSRVLGIIGLVVGFIFLVTCVSCISCIRPRFKNNWYYRGRGYWY
ncbi:MAG: hypothetical protein SOZ40_02865 [Ezakiella sp.]|nr:hypothetical protein [Ezakiella sp.]MDD7761380.1 hypothetical protein [Bacillota bacterium]MDY3946932.1 hypothetical protein [Ezakiella sp.]